MNSGMVREDSDVGLEASHFAFLQQNKNILANNVLWKRKEQLVKWETSETNCLSSVRKLSREPKVKFTDEDIFLSACLSGDLEEVQTLLDDGANINTSTVDGLTALHQAVIDGKPKMVQFLVEHGANVNAQDNEGWTPLHAAACCGNFDLVEYLCAEGADISVTNSDKELAVDLAEEDDCRLALEEEHQRQGIDPNECRNRELTIMRRDAEQWLRDGEMDDHPHSRTGATALHVAAAKGYNDVIRLLLKAGADVNCRDRDGWTPLHAAAHWAEDEAAAILIQNGASFSELTNNGETVLNVADKDIVEYLEGMQEKERLKITSSSSVCVLVHSNAPLKRAGSTTSVSRISTKEKTKKTKLDERDEKNELKEGDYSFIIEDDSPSSSVEVRLPFPVKRQQSETSESLAEEERSSSKSNSESCSEEKTASVTESKSSDTDKGESSTSESVTFSMSDQKTSLSIEERLAHVATSTSPSPAAPIVSAFVSESKSPSEVRNSTSPSSFSTMNSLSSRPAVSDSNSSISLSENQPLLKAHSAEKEFTTAVASLEPSSRFSKSVNLQRSTSKPVPWMPLYRSSAIKGPLHPAFAHFQAAVRQAATSTMNRSQPATNACSLQTSLSSFSRGSLATPPMEPNMPNESEAERRSRAKRQRDSRRSTQGVTREQLRVASALTVRRDDKERERENEMQKNGKCFSYSLDSTPLHEIEKRVAEENKDLDAATCGSSQSLSAVRRRSQAPRTTRRVTGPVRIDDLQSDSSSQSLDDSVQKSGCDMSLTSIITPSSSNVDRSFSASAATSYNFRDSSLTTIAYTQAALAGKARTTQINSIHIGGSTTTTASFQMHNSKGKYQVTAVDYKSLYEKEKQETERLRRRIEELALEKSNSTDNISLLKYNVGGRFKPLPSLNKFPSSTPVNDRERHNYEHQIAEMQYKIEQLEHLRADNQKLKEENGALIRVISKLSK